MEAILQVLTEISRVLGVPAVILIVWLLSIIRDHSKRIEKLEAALEESNKSHLSDLSKLYDKVNEMAENVAYIRGNLDKSSNKDKS